MRIFKRVATNPAITAFYLLRSKQAFELSKQPFPCHLLRIRQGLISILDFHPASVDWAFSPI